MTTSNFLLRKLSNLPFSFQFGEFLRLTSEKFALRTAHSTLVGYWTTEIGGLNQVVHIWYYGQ